MAFEHENIQSNMMYAPVEVRMVADDLELTVHEGRLQAEAIRERLDTQAATHKDTYTYR
jgi:hypothetical protein